MIHARTGQVTLFCLLTGVAAIASAQQDNIPALLQFAEQYQSQQAPITQPSEPKQSKPAKTPTVAGGKSPALPREQSVQKKQPSPSAKSWQLKDGQIRQQQTQIAQLEKQLALLKKAQAEKPITPLPATEPDLKTLGALVQNLKQALAPPPTQQKMLENLQQAQQQNETQRNIARQLNVKIGSVEKENQALQNQQKALHTQYQTTQALQQKQNIELDKLYADLARQKAATPDAVNANSLKAAPARQAYAAGISLGEEILQMQAERQTWGVKADKKLILAGVVDAFSGQRKLTDSELNQALSTSEKSVLAARSTVLEKQEKQGEDYLATFKKNKNVKQASEGFWYRLDYVGDNPITEQAIVDVVVKETLTDGTVIQDMEANGVTLSQKVADFPPLFQAAIKLLKNHGSMQLVAPPELAYGEKGYPPKIPPNATMVYTLRIAEMYPENKASTTIGVKPEARR